MGADRGERVIGQRLKNIAGLRHDDVFVVIDGTVHSGGGRQLHGSNVNRRLGRYAGERRARPPRPTRSRESAAP